MTEESGLHKDEFGRVVRRDDEQNKLICYIDNATIINACNLLMPQGIMNPYHVADLESFCQAFLLYDGVRTLVGSSFACGFSGGYTQPYRTRGQDPEDIFWETDPNRVQVDLTRPPPMLRTTADLYEYLIDGGYLRPVVKGAGTVHYYIENIEMLDEISRQIDVEESVDLVRKLFPDGLPWSSHVPDEYGKKGSNEDQDWVDREAREAATQTAASSVIVGSDAWTSDSYPIYYFPVDNPRKRGTEDHDFGWEINHNRVTSWESAMVSQTFFYVIEASVQGKPLICSSVRTPIVSDLAGRLNSQVQGIIQASLSAVDKTTRDKITQINRFFGTGGIKFLFVPALLCVVREAVSRQDFIPAIFRLRDQPKFVEFREWCRRAERAWEAEDISEIYSSLKAIKEAVREISADSGSTPLDGVLSRLPDPRILTKKGIADASMNPGALTRTAYSPALALIRDFTEVLSMGRHGIEGLEALFEAKLSSTDRTVLSDLAEKQRRSRPPGDLSGLEEAFAQVDVEVVVGDKFEGINISGQGVALGRGAQAEVRDSVNSSQPDQNLSEALIELARSIRGQVGRVDADVEATIIEAAAKKAEQGDEAGAAAMLKKSASWVLDLAKSAGSAILTGFVKSQLGIG